jgi:hypothetical protein
MHQAVYPNFPFVIVRTDSRRCIGNLERDFGFSDTNGTNDQEEGINWIFCHTEQNEIMGGMGSMYIAAALLHRHGGYVVLDATPARAE